MTTAADLVNLTKARPGLSEFDAAQVRGPISRDRGLPGRSWSRRRGESGLGSPRSRCASGASDPRRADAENIALRVDEIPAAPGTAQDRHALTLQPRQFGIDVINGDDEFAGLVFPGSRR